MSDSKEQGFQLFDLASDSVEWTRQASSESSRSGSKSSNASIRTSSGEKLPPSVSPLSPEGGPYRLDSKYDCVAFVVHCAKHDQVAVAKRPNAKAVWLPFTPLPANK